MSDTTASLGLARGPRPGRFRRFKFIFRMVMLVLPIGFFALSRSNPDLHLALVSKTSEVLAPYIGSDDESGTTMAQRFKDKVKVNRFGNSNQGNAFNSGGSRANAQAQANDVGRSLSSFEIGG